MEILKAYELINNEIKEIKLNGFYKNNTENKLLNIYPLEKEKFYGFGGAITEASAYNYSLLSTEDKKNFLEMLVGDTGLKYRLFRISISSSDFTLDSYDYLDSNDQTLNSFKITRDKKYIIPLIKDIISYAKYDVKFIASSWSPPAFMKDTNKRNYGGKLLENYYDLYALYLIKFIEAYKNEKINISYLTIQNEPLAIQTWESCYFTTEEEIKFAKILNKHIKSHNLNTLLLCWDHNKERLFERADKIFTETNFFAGAGFHWYSGDHFEAILALKKKYPDKLIFETEFCKSLSFDETNGSYINEIINDLRYGANGIVEWNILLDDNGGPFHDRGNYLYAGCDAPLRLNNKKLIKGSYYNEMWMFSNLVDYNASILYTSSFDEKIKVSALKNLDGTIAIFIYNEFKDKNCSIYINGKFLDLNLKEKSLVTIYIK